MKLLSYVHTAQRLHFTNRNFQIDKMAILVISLGRGVFLSTYSDQYYVSDLFKNGYCLARV